MEKASVLCKNNKQLNVAKAICENLPMGLLGCWGVLYTATKEQKIKLNEHDCIFEDFIKGWYSDISGIDYI